MPNAPLIMEHHYFWNLWGNLASGTVIIQSLRCILSEADIIGNVQVGSLGSATFSCNADTIDI